MKKINGGDTIPYGIYSGKKLGNVVKKYGREVLLEIVKFNEVDDDFLKKYHYHHPATEEEKIAWELKKRQMGMIQEDNRISAPVQEIHETTSTEECTEDYEENQDVIVENDPWDSVLYDPEDDPDDYKKNYPQEKDWQNYPYDGDDMETIGNERI